MAREEREQESREQKRKIGDATCSQSPGQAKKPKLGGAKKQICDAMKSQRRIWGDVIDRDSVRREVNPNNCKSFNSRLSDLKASGLIECDTVHLRFTELGLHEADVDPLPPTNRERMALLREAIPNEDAKIVFDVLTDGTYHSRQDLHAKVCTPIGQEQMRISILSLAKITERDSSGREIRLKDHAFPQGRPMEGTCAATSDAPGATV